MTQMLDDNQDEDQLRLLPIVYYVVAGFVGFFSLFPLDVSSHYLNLL